MQWLPHEVLDELNLMLERLEGDGFSASRPDVICALILACEPTDPDIPAAIRALRTEERRVRPRERLRGAPVVLRMPSPITLRLDGLVRLLSGSGDRVYRHEVISALIRGSDQAEDLEEKCRRYARAVAADARVSGESRRAVLSLKKPRPGARL